MYKLFTTVIVSTAENIYTEMHCTEKVGRNSGTDCPLS